MDSDTSGRPRLTVKGARTRARIVESAAALIHERGVAGTTLEDVKVAAEVSGSQMYHYFPDKDELVQAVAETDPLARDLIASGFDQWASAIADGLRSLRAEGRLPSDVDPDDLAITLLATLEGGLLLAQVQRSTRPFETAVNTVLSLIVGR